MEKSLRELKLTNDELNRLGNAFKDPEFCKLFAEYAEEINDPENKRRYEEEIKIAESERGMDVEFIKPTPFCVLKSRNWPSLASSTSKSKEGKVEEVPESKEGQRLYINICSSDKIEPPSYLPHPNLSFPVWNVPHTLSPPIEDVDNDKKLCLVVDVVFHPTAIDQARAKKALRNFLHASAVQSVHERFGYFMGPTKEGAKTTWESSKPQEAQLLATVQLVKRANHKGSLRATVIRKKRADFEECQERLAEAEKAAFAEARKSANPKESLAALCKFKEYMDRNLQAAEDKGKRGKANQGHDKSSPSSKYKEPDVKIKHCSEFDMLDYTNDCHNEVRSTRPSALCVEVSLPGIESAASLDVDIKDKKLVLKSEKPVAYQLDLDLPYPVDSEKAKATFHSASHKLSFRLPVIPAPVTKPVMSEAAPQVEESPTPLIEVIETEKPKDGEANGHLSTASEEGSDDTAGSSSKKRRRKKHKKSSTSNNGGSTCGETEHAEGHESASSSAASAPGDTPTSNSIAVEQLPRSKLKVPKTSSLASVRVRQDASSLTLVLEVRHVLPDSLQLAWSPVVAAIATATTVDKHQQQQEALQLMLTCTSRGGGGCSLHWGIVLHCPAPSLLDSTKEDSLKGEEEEEEAKDHHQQPSGFEDGQEALQPPRVLSCAVDANNVAIVIEKPATLCTWWNSVAVGRALGPGLQEVPLIGPIPEPPPSPSPCEVSVQKSSLCLVSQSVDSAHLSFGQENGQATPDSHSSSGSAFLPYEPKRCHSLESEGVLPRRGILKVRTPSESSLDGSGPVLYGSSLGALAPPPQMICSDEFPSNSEEEDSVFPPPSAPPTQGRRRINSVNFSKKDENVAFSPYEPVQKLHDTLRNRAKNARRLERRKRHNSFTSSSITMSEMHAAGEGDHNESETSHLNQKQKRKLQRKQKRDEYSREKAKFQQTEPSEGPKNDGSDSAVCVESEPEAGKSVEAKPMNGKQLGPGLWKAEEIYGKGGTLNPHVTLCPVELNANPIFELDEEM